MITYENHKKIGKTIKEIENILSQLIKMTKLKASSVDKVFKRIHTLYYIKNILEDDLVENYNKKDMNKIYYNSSDIKINLEQRK